MISSGTVLALAQQDCSICLGLGTTSTRGNGKLRACYCVWRAIFRACLNRFNRAFEYAGYRNPVRAFTEASKPLHKRQLVMLEEDYLADFVLLAKRALRTNPLGWKIFRYNVLLGADWRLCCRKLRMDRGAFFHEVYRMQQTVGRAFAATVPYPLYPIDEYFGGTVRVARLPRPESLGTLSPLPSDRTEGVTQPGRPLRAPLASNRAQRAADALCASPHAQKAS